MPSPVCPNTLDIQLRSVLLQELFLISNLFFCRSYASKITLRVVRQQPRRLELLANPQHLAPLNRRTLVFLEPNLLSKPLLLRLGVQTLQTLPIPVQLLASLANPSTSQRPRILATYLGVVPSVNHNNHSSSSSSHNNRMRLEVEPRSGSPSNSRPMLLAVERQFLVIMHPNPRSPLSVEVRIYSSQ